MSGHNKWSQIKNKKALSDQKRGQIFSRLTKLITLAARNGIDPKSNPALSQIIQKAKTENMPNENIERAIKKVSDKSTQELETIIVEAIGPGGCAIKINAITDNRNRTISEIKKILTNHEIKMVPPNSLSWMFNQPPIKLSEEDQKKLDKLFEELDDHGDVEDVITNTE